MIGKSTARTSRMGPRAVIGYPTARNKPHSQPVYGFMRLIHFLCTFFVLTLPIHAADHPATTIREDFEHGADRWLPTDAANWRVADDHGGKVFELFESKTQFQPPYRSPFNFALLKDVKAGSFTLTAALKTTKAAYGHRDLCLIFGYQDPSHFYYVHLGEKTDDHANQIFIVNDAPRIKISTKTTTGTPWQENQWHQVKLVRDAAAGTTRVFFDDMSTPAMEAKDTTFGPGQIGIGSFDDIGRFDDIVLTGELTQK